MRPLTALVAVAAGALFVTASAQIPVFHAIGCISRAGSSYVITDTRADPPVQYRLGGDAEKLQLDFHVGHTVEVAGPVASNGVLTVQSLVWISNSCERSAAAD